MSKFPALKPYISQRSSSFKIKYVIFRLQLTCRVNALKGHLVPCNSNSNWNCSCTWNCHYWNCKSKNCFWSIAYNRQSQMHFQLFGCMMLKVIWTPVHEIPPLLTTPPPSLPNILAHLHKTCRALVIDKISRKKIFEVKSIGMFLLITWYIQICSLVYLCKKLCCRFLAWMQTRCSFYQK